MNLSEPCSMANKCACRKFSDSMEAIGDVKFQEITLSLMDPKTAPVDQKVERKELPLDASKKVVTVRPVAYGNMEKM